MARRSLRPHLNQIRTWVRQGRTDAWIAHQLEVTVQQIEAFKREQGLAPDEEGEGAATGTDFDDEIDLRAEDDELIAAELEAAEAEAGEDADEDDDGDEENGEDDDDGEPRRRRTRRGGRRRRGTRGRRGGQPLEGTFDHGEEGYGLWLDRPVTVTIEEEQIVIRRSGDDNDEEEGD